MSEGSADDIRKQVRAYVGVFIALCVFTVVTVMASFLEMDHDAFAIALGLAIALVKGTLVALYFMHLNHERALIYGSLALTVTFFVALIALPVVTSLGSSRDDEHIFVAPERPAAVKHHEE